MSPVVTMAIHTFVQWAFGFSYILFVATAARDQIHKKVYLISCSSCNKQYVGETKGPLNKRMNGHRDDWRHRRFERSPTAEHFHSADHDFLSNASVCCLEHNKEWSDSTRKLRESYWIRRLNTLCPFGINKGD